MRIAVMASGTGSNLQVLLDTVHGRDGITVAGVASDKPGALALERAAAAGVPTRVFPRADFADRRARDAAIADWLDELGVGLVVLAGYMAILDGAFIARFAGRIVNVHPSLLPAFTGLHAVQQAVDYGVKVFGVTVHFVDEGVDTGPVILQDSIVLENAVDADAVLAALRPLEHRLLHPRHRRSGDHDRPAGRLHEQQRRCPASRGWGCRHRHRRIATSDSSWMAMAPSCSACINGARTSIRLWPAPTSRNPATACCCSSASTISTRHCRGHAHWLRDWPRNRT